MKAILIGGEYHGEQLDLNGPQRVIYKEPQKYDHQPLHMHTEVADTVIDVIAYIETGVTATGLCVYECPCDADWVPYVDLKAENKDQAKEIERLQKECNMLQVRLKS